jgi:hypothetical protein
MSLLGTPSLKNNDSLLGTPRVKTISLPSTHRVLNSYSLPGTGTPWAKNNYSLPELLGLKQLQPTSTLRV